MLTQIPGPARNAPVHEFIRKFRLLSLMLAPSSLGRIPLENIALKPLLGVVKRFKELGLKTSDGYRVVEELRNLRLIAPLTVDGKRLEPGPKH